MNMHSVNSQLTMIGVACTVLWIVTSYVDKVLWLACFNLLLLTISAQSVPKAWPTNNLGARTQILQGVSTFKFPPDAAGIYVLKRNAEAIGWAARIRLPFLTASQVGRGRIVLFSSYSFAHYKSDPTYGLVHRNIVKWVSQGQQWDSQDLMNVRNQLKTATGTYHYYPAYSFTAAETALMVEAVKAGRMNLVLYVTQNSPELQPLLREAGVVVAKKLIYASDGYTNIPVDDLLSCPVDPAETVFSSLASSEAQFFCSAANAFSAVEHMPPEDAPYVTFGKTEEVKRIMASRERHAATVAPSPSRPITDAINQTWVNIYNRIFEASNTLIYSYVRASGLSEFPGDVDWNKAKYVTADITIKAAFINEVHQIGLYLPPGGTTSVEVLEVSGGSAIKDWKIIIGCWSDSLTNAPQYKRFPEMSQVHSLPMKAIHSSFGGNIQIQNEATGSIRLRLTNVFETPYMNLRDPASIRDWQSRVGRSGAPWADLVGDMISFCLPSKYVQKLSSSEMEYMLRNVWDNVVKYDFDMVGDDWKTSVRERIILDPQPSLGYAHSGYPIVGTLVDDLAMCIADRAYAFKTGSWGLTHELGHNRQKPSFTWTETTEVTNNIFTLFSRSVVFNIPMFEHEPRMWEKERRDTLTAHIKNGAPYSGWNSDSFIALAIYEQFAKHFGWGTMSKWMHTYTRRAKEFRWVANKEDSINQWAERMSNVTQMNVVPLFDYWNIPLSQSARSSFSHLPCFLPRDWITALDNYNRYNQIHARHGNRCYTTALYSYTFPTSADIHNLRQNDVIVSVR